MALRKLPLYPPQEWVDAAKGATTAVGQRVYLDTVNPDAGDGNPGDVWIKVDSGRFLIKEADDATWTIVGTVAVLASPVFTGVPTAPTAAPATDTTQIATTEFVNDAIAAAGSSSGLSAGKAYAVARGFFIQ